MSGRSARAASERASLGEDRPAGSAYERLFLRMLDTHLDGRIQFEVGGQTLVAGRASAERRAPSEVTVKVHDPDFFRRVTCYGNLGMGEAYMAGQFEMAHAVDAIDQALRKAGVTWSWLAEIVAGGRGSETRKAA